MKEVIKNAITNPCADCRKNIYCRRDCKEKRIYNQQILNNAVKHVLNEHFGLDVNDLIRGKEK
jgi:cytidine deaminase